MPIIIAILAALGAVYFFVIRARNAAHMAEELVDVANDVRLAARRFGFSRKQNQHPVESIEDANLAIGALAGAFLELDDLPTREQRDRLDVQLRKELQIDAETAEEVTVLGRWLISQCNGPEQAVPRLSRKLYKLAGSAAIQPVLTIIKGTMPQDGDGLSNRQQDALLEIKRAFRLT